jgi:hypothetical protein
MTERPDRLRLRAEDLEDLAVLAACLQDARVSLREMVFDPNERRFMAAFLRYRRETVVDPGCTDGWTRCPTALVFNRVESVRYRGLDTADETAEHRVLTMLGRTVETGFEVMLFFADGGAIRLEMGEVQARLDDFGECECCQPPADPLAAELATAS